MNTRLKSTTTPAKNSPTEVNHTLWFFGKMLQKLVITTFMAMGTHLNVMQKRTDTLMFELENTIKTFILSAKT
jgi:hypothetical protein